VVSLTGDTVEGYPPLSAINGGPPFHPNCAHVLMPFVIALATPEERAAGKIEPDLLNKTPANLQRRFTKQFPERARAAGRRRLIESRVEALAGKGRVKASRPKVEVAAGGS
jgi:hypothetical protein